jgi:hypothetical protein
MRDSGSIVLGWLLKLAVSLAVLGFGAFDGIALVTADVQATDHAATAASAAADSFRATQDRDTAYKAAVDAVAGEGDTIADKDFSVEPDGTVHLKLHREASTLWLHRVGPLKDYADVTGEAEGTPPP